MIAQPTRCLIAFSDGEPEWRPVSRGWRPVQRGSDWPGLWPVRVCAYFTVVLTVIRPAWRPLPALRQVFALVTLIS
jgi:hypothetical protein